MGNNEHSEENRRTSVGFRVQVFTFLLVPVAVIALAYYWPSVIHAEDKTAVEALHSCETCNKCFSCLQNENDQDLFSFCQNQFTVMSCVQQTIFIYGEPNGQPCYAECGPCAKCLNNTEHFNELERLTQPYWQVSYPGLFHTQGEMDEISQSISKVRKISDAGLTNFSLCCETSSDDIPFTEKQKVDNSIWYPVWFGYKDKSKNKYQYNYNVSCGSPCGDYTCHVENLLIAFLLSNKKPHRISGYTNKHLHLQLDAEFVHIKTKAYCQSMN